MQSEPSSEAEYRRAGIGAFLAFTILLWSAAGAQTTADQIDGPRDAIHDFQVYWNRGAAAEVVQLFTERGILLLPNGKKAATQGAIKELITRDFQDIFRGSTLTLSIESLHRAVDNTAIVHGSYELRGIDAMVFLEVTRSGAFTARLREAKGRWKIAAAEFARE